MFRGFFGRAESLHLLARAFGVANTAVAVEQRARFDHQFGGADVAVDPTAADDFQPPGIDIARESAADNDVVGLKIAFDMPCLSDGDFRLGANRPLDASIDVQVVAQGKVADKL